MQVGYNQHTIKKLTIKVVDKIIKSLILGEANQNVNYS